MGRREQRETIFHLLFMTEFNAAEEMAEQKTLFMEGIEKIKEKDQMYIHDKYEKIREKITELDTMINETSKGWKTTRMNKVDLTILRLGAYEALFDEDRKSVV